MTRSYLGFATALALTLPAEGPARPTGARVDALEQTASIPEENCRTPPGWSQIVKRHPDFVVFGELHGTRQTPTFVGNIACALASRGQRLLIAVEHPSAENAAYQAAWRLPPAQFADTLRAASWAGGNDGRTSEAMFRLLVRLHRLAAQGRRIDIVAFNGVRHDAQKQKFAGLPAPEVHEAAQADNIRIAAGARSYDRVLVLVGNAHARKKSIDRGNIRYRPMAMHLGPADRIVSLDVETSGGTMWGCYLRPGFKFDSGKPMPDDAFICGASPVNGSTDLKRSPFISLSAFPGSDDAGAYDGFFWLGSVSSSPPAVPNR